MAHVPRTGKPALTYSAQLIDKSNNLVRDSEALRRYGLLLRARVKDAMSSLRQVAAAGRSSIDRSTAIPETRMPRMKIVEGRHFAEILVGRRNGGVAYYWVVQLVGSSEVLALGNEDTFAQCEVAARECLQGFGDRKN